MVTEQSGPLPQRIGDAERDRAVEMLRDNLAEGRLDQSEFDERITAALTAKTQADLDPLFADLPGPRPDGSTVAPTSTLPLAGAQTGSSAVVPRPAVAPPATSMSKAWGVASGFAWPAAIIFCFATNWQFWWVMLIPVFFPWWLGNGHKGSHRR